MEGMTAWPRCAWACAAPAAVFPAPCVCTPTAALAVGLCSAVAVAWVRGLPLENHGPTAVDINMGGGRSKMGNPKIIGFLSMGVARMFP